MAERTPLLLLPGLLCDAGLWAPQADALADVAEVQVADLTQDDRMEAMAARVLAQAPDAQCPLLPSNVQRGVILNRAAPPFDNPDIRRAVALAIDRKAFLDILTQGTGDIGGAVLGTLMTKGGRRMLGTGIEIGGAASQAARGERGPLSAGERASSSARSIWVKVEELR